MYGKEHLSITETIGVREGEELTLAKVERCLRERAEGLLEVNLEAEQLSSGKLNRWRGRVTARVEPRAMGDYRVPAGAPSSLRIPRASIWTSLYTSWYTKGRMTLRR